MTVKPLAAIALLAAALLSSAAVAQPKPASRPLLIQQDTIATSGAGPHEGKGPTVGFPFSVTAGSKHLYFSRRVMHPGSTVGKHVMDLNEVYYIADGEAELIDDVGPRPVKAGTAIFLTPGQSIELRQKGPKDVILIVANYTP
jgi:mannose-6-phosphate isomerase-like protein (cupin superfamily)